MKPGNRPTKLEYQAGFGEAADRARGRELRWPPAGTLQEALHAGPRPYVAGDGLSYVLGCGGGRGGRPSGERRPLIACAQCTQRSACSARRSMQRVSRSARTTVNPTSSSAPGNEFSTEALPGALPQGQNNPRVRPRAGPHSVPHMHRSACRARGSVRSSRLQEQLAAP